MFAGLPGIGVGTLFYVLAALWMPVPEIGRLLRGTSSAARWRRIGVQWIYAFSVMASVALADRVMLWVLGADSPASVGPARMLHDQLGARVPDSFFAAPIAASLLLLGGVLLIVEVCARVRALWSSGVGLRDGEVTPAGEPPVGERV